MDFVSSKTIARDIIIRKNVKIMISAKRLRFANRDTQNHHTESVKSKVSTNEIEKKVEVLETMVLEMAKKVVKLEAELKGSKTK